MIRKVVDGVHAHEAPLSLAPGFRLPGRATLLRRRDGGLVVHSPLPIDDETARDIAALGEVTAIVAPSQVHWLFVAAAKARWPNAHVFGAPGLEKKLPIPFEPLPESGALDDDILVRRVAGAPKLEEHVLYHRPSRTLVVTDLLFNVHGGTSVAAGLFLRAMGAWGEPMQSKVWRFLVKDRERAAESASEILRWDFERTIMAHGDPIEVEAAAATRRALGWIVSAA